MAFSPTTAKALEQVKMGLLMLYGADYFTQDEWVKMDALIHKGKYVFTAGPRNNILDEELMTFEESQDETIFVSVHNKVAQPSDHIKTDTVTVSEEQIGSSSSSDPADSIQFSSKETPNETSAEPSSSDGDSHPESKIQVEDAAMYDFSEWTAAVPSESKSPEPIPEQQPTNSSNGLPPGITQEQLDYAKSLQASMTKAGQKTRPKFQSEEDAYPSPSWTEEFPSESVREEEAYPSPAPTERDTRIRSWASEINHEGTTPAEVVSPAPSKLPPKPSVLVEEFVNVHGRKPKCINDILQPNNPQHHSNRSVSGTSQITSKTTKSVPRSDVKSVVAPAIASPGTITLNRTYVAQSDYHPNGAIQIQVMAGDRVKVLKHVSGIMYVGVNERTSKQGQFSHNVFKKSPSTQKQTLGHVASSSAAFASVHNGLDKVERIESMNAAEWDEVPTVSRHKIAGPAAVRPTLGGGLGASRFAAIADEASITSPSSSGQQEMSLAMKKELGAMFDEKVDQILKARGIAPTNPSIRAATLPSVTPPKMNVCWYWKTGKGCRFTAEECRDLHQYSTGTPNEPTNLHLGKPTWGALADYRAPLTPANPDTFSVPTMPSGLVDLKRAGKTCWYWANNGKCDYSDENCKYLHAHTSEGVAARPMMNKHRKWVGSSWRAGMDGGDNATWGDAGASGWSEDGGAGEPGWASGLQAEAEGEDELVLEEVGESQWGVIGDGGAGGWGRDTPAPVLNGWGEPERAGDDKYKVPHKRMEAVGW